MVVLSLVAKDSLLHCSTLKIALVLPLVVRNEVRPWSLYVRRLNVWSALE